MASGFEFLGPKNNDVNKQQSGTTTQDTQLVFDPETKKFLDSKLKSTDYSKSAALTDAKGAADYTMQQVLQSGAPGITSSDKAAGGYDNTTTGLLGNDLQAKASAAGSKVLLDTIVQYANADANQINAGTGAVAATTSKKSTQVVDMKDNTQNRSAGALWDSMNPGKVAGGRYSGDGAQSATQPFGGSGQGLASTAPGGGTVICTQLYLDGHVAKVVYSADNKYVREHFHANTINGYRFWAVPFVMAMRKYGWVYAVGKYFGTRWSEHCASHYTHHAKPNAVGKWLIRIMVPICFCIGSVIPEVKYYKLWAGS